MSISKFFKSDSHFKTPKIHLVGNTTEKRFLLILVVSILFLAACSKSSGADNGLWRLLPENINSFKTFLKAFLIVSVIQISIGVTLRLLIGISLNFVISLVLFIIVLVTKDYGFFLTLLLFAVGYLPSFFINFIRQRR